MLLTEAVKQLCSVHAEGTDTEGSLDLWRGMKDLKATSDFQSSGGTELSPLSTTADPAIALNYSASTCQLLFKIHAACMIDRAADLSYLSAFPSECEFLYPPLTFLKPTGRRQDLTLGEREITVIELEPRKV